PSPAGEHRPEPDRGGPAADTDRAPRTDAAPRGVPRGDPARRWRPTSWVAASRRSPTAMSARRAPSTRATRARRRIPRPSQGLGAILTPSARLLWSLGSPPDATVSLGRPLQVVRR